MDSQTIIQKLKEGWSLSNRNCGWFLAEPQKPYNTLHAKLIENNDEVANESTD